MIKLSALSKEEFMYVRVREQASTTERTALSIGFIFSRFLGRCLPLTARRKARAGGGDQDGPRKCCFCVDLFYCYHVCLGVCTRTFFIPSIGLLRERKGTAIKIMERGVGERARG